MEAYLFGAFHHRFNRALKKERRRIQTVRYLPSSHDLERLGQAHDSKAVSDLEESIQLKEAVRNMDEWTRKVWAARQYGYSWKEIAIQLGLTEHQVKLRFGTGRKRWHFYLSELDHWLRSQVISGSHPRRQPQGDYIG
jgi:DNA-directed RNA polymerase specialized sigma24 family protein